jgi:hypothetical protein
VASYTGHCRQGSSLLGQTLWVRGSTWADCRRFSFSAWTGYCSFVHLASRQMTGSECPSSSLSLSCHQTWAFGPSQHIPEVFCVAPFRQSYTRCSCSRCGSCRYANVLGIRHSEDRHAGARGTGIPKATWELREQGAESQCRGPRSQLWGRMGGEWGGREQELSQELSSSNSSHCLQSSSTWFSW